MSEEWVDTTLGELAEIVGGGTPSTSEASYWGEDVVWLTPTEVVKADGTRIGSSGRMISSSGLANSSAKMLPRNTVLLTTRASVGFVALADCDLATNQGFQSLIPGPSVIPEFLMYWVQGNRTEFASRAGGSTFPEIGKSKVQTIPITLPPLPVQRRIVDLMTHLDTHIANLQAEREAAQRAAESLSEVLMDGHPLRSVRDVADSSRGLVGGPFGSSLVSKDYTESGIPVIRGANMPKGGKFIEGPFIFVSPEKAQSLKSNLAYDGDVIFTQRGTLGQVGLVAQGQGPLVISQSQMRLRPDSEVALSEYVYYAFSRPSVVQQIRSLNTATANPHINLGILAVMEFPLPDLEQQSAICMDLRHAFDHCAALQADIDGSVHLRLSLLSDLLGGTVEVSTGYDAMLLEVA